jgi:twinkle protein
VILTPDKIDFAQYLAAVPEVANVHSPVGYADPVKALFRAQADGTGLTLPWAKTHEKIRVRPGEVSGWSGINGHGKSLILSQVVLHLMQHDEKVCLASMEMKPAESLHRMAQQAAGMPVPSDDYVDAFLRWLDGRLFLYDQLGTVKRDRILALARYAQKEVGCGQMVIDSLMKCGIGTQDYDAQKDFIDELSAHAKDTGQHVHIVAHSKKVESEDAPLDKMAVKGASEIVDQLDNLYIVWRNKAKEKSMARGETKFINEPDALLMNEKQRHGRAGSEATYGLALDRASQCFLERGAFHQPLRLDTAIEVPF